MIAILQPTERKRACRMYIHYLIVSPPANTSTLTYFLVGGGFQICNYSNKGSEYCNAMNTHDVFHGILLWSYKKGGRSEISMVCYRDIVYITSINYHKCPFEKTEWSRSSSLKFKAAGSRWTRQMTLACCGNVFGIFWPLRFSLIPVRSFIRVPFLPLLRA